MCDHLGDTSNRVVLSVRGAFGPLLAEIDWLHAVVVEVTCNLGSTR